MLAFIAFLFSLVPLVGTLTGSIIIVLICLIPGLGSPLTGLVAAIYYLVYMQIEAYVLSPRIMSRAVKVPGALVVVAALAGGALLGILVPSSRSRSRRRCCSSSSRSSSRARTSAERVTAGGATSTDQAVGWVTDAAGHSSATAAPTG